MFRTFVFAAFLAPIVGCTAGVYVHHGPVVAEVHVDPMVNVVVGYTHWHPETVWYWSHCGCTWGEIVLLHDVAFYAHVSPHVVWEFHWTSHHAWTETVACYHVEESIVHQYYESTTTVETFSSITDEQLVHSATVDAVADVYDVPESEVEGLLAEGHTDEQIAAAFDQTAVDTDVEGVRSALAAEAEHPAEVEAQPEEPAAEEPPAEAEEVPAREGGDDDEEKKPEEGGR